MKTLGQTYPDRLVLLQNDYFEIVQINWTPQSNSVMHDHGWSQCQVLIEEGEFTNTLDLGYKTEVQKLRAGQILSTPVGAQHLLRCESRQGRTLHVYTPKIQSLAEVKKFNAKFEKLSAQQLQLKHAHDIHELRVLLDDIKKTSVSTHSPYFMNQLFAGVLPQMLMAEEVIAQTRTTLATQEAAPVYSQIEKQVIASLAELMGWPADKAEGVTVPGGSAANFMALHCARHRRFPQIKSQGMGSQKLIVFTSSAAHYSMKKACLALGFGTDQLRLIATERNGQMNLQKLQEQISVSLQLGEVPLMVCATAGTTVSGAFDPLEAISQICKTHNMWLHVDGAWGGPALFAKKLQHLLNGIELADSMTFDAHKLLGAGLTCSFFINQHRGLLLDANDVSGTEYLFHNTEEADLDRGKLSWQCGRRPDALSFWTLWKSVGTEGLGDFVERLLLVRDQTLAWLKTQPRLELVSEPAYLNLCIRIEPPNESDIRDWSQKVRENLKDNNLAMVNYSTDGDGSFLRLILAHPQIDFRHVQQILQWALAVQ